MSLILAAMALLLPFASLVPASISFPVLNKSVRVALADTIVVGKVIAIEEKTEAHLPNRYPNAEKIDFRIVVVEVKEALLGAKEKKTVRIGFSGRPELKLAVGQEACFFLMPHFEEKFYTLLAVDGAVNSVIARKDACSFEKEMTEVRKSARLLNERAGLKSKEPKDRYHTAALLVVHYRAAQWNEPLTEELVDKKESELILKGLADADWSVLDAGDDLNILMTFRMVTNVHAKNWKAPDDFKQYPAAAKKWLQDHASTYRIRKIVPDRSVKKK
jgi:hypothetical protein